MVLRTLDGEIQRQLQPVGGGGLAQRAEVFDRAQLRVDVGMATFVGADGVGAADIGVAGGKRVVLALAEGLADRMDRWEVQHVEAHRLDSGQALDHVAEAAVAAGIVGR
jgi:hypothetical protein